MHSWTRRAPASYSWFSPDETPIWPGCIVFDFVAEGETVYLENETNIHESKDKAGPLWTDLGGFLKNRITPTPIPEKGLHGAMADWIPAPDGKHLVHVVPHGSKGRWYWVDTRTGQKTELGADTPAAPFDLGTYFWNSDCSFLFLCRNEATQGRSQINVTAIPISEKKAMDIHLDYVGNGTAANPLVCDVEQ